MLFDLGYNAREHKSSRPGYRGTSLQDFHRAFPSEQACFDHLMRLRYGSDPECPRCGRTGRWQRHPIQKHFFHPCGGILSPMVNTMFDRTRIPLQLWFYAMLHFANSSQSVPSRFLARQLGISEPTAFRMASRIRFHLAAIDNELVLGKAGGFVFVRILTIRRVVNPEPGGFNRVRVVALGDNARAHATVIVRPKTQDLRRIISIRTTRCARLITDCAATYRVFATYGNARPILDHDPIFFLENPHLNDRIHGFHSYFWNSFQDQLRTVTRKEFWKYLKEYEFRYNRREASQSTFWDMVSEFPDLCNADISRLRLANTCINVTESDIA